MDSNRLRPRRVFRPVVDALAVFMIRLRVTPNRATAVGTLLATTAPFLMASGGFLPFGIIVFFVGLMDGVDGAIARMTKASTKWGGFLDSLLDRYGDSVIILSYLFCPVTSPLGEAIILAIPFGTWVCIAIVGSLMVSYTRAKSEAIGSRDSDVGIAARSERLLLLSITGILGVFNEYILVYGLVVVALLANITAFQRIAHTNSILRKDEKALKHYRKGRQSQRTNS